MNILIYSSLLIHSPPSSILSIGLDWVQCSSALDPLQCGHMTKIGHAVLRSEQDPVQVPQTYPKKKRKKKKKEKKRNFLFFDK